VDKILIFETRVFGADLPERVSNRFYTHLDEARRGHVACVNDIKEKRSPWWTRGVTLGDLPTLECDAILRDELE
jgi:hypothetical protein